MKPAASGLCQPEKWTVVNARDVRTHNTAKHTGDQSCVNARRPDVNKPRPICLRHFTHTWVVWCVGVLCVRAVMRACVILRRVWHTSTYLNQLPENFLRRHKLRAAEKWFNFVKLTPTSNIVAGTRVSRPFVAFHEDACRVNRERAHHHPSLNQSCAEGCWFKMRINMCMEF